MNEVASIYRPLSPIGRDGLVRYLTQRYGRALDVVGENFPEIGWAVDDIVHAYGADGNAIYGEALDVVLDEAPETWSAVISAVARTIREELAR